MTEKSSPTALARARREAHQAFDPLWMNAAHLYAEKHRRRAGAREALKKLARERAYEWLSEQLGIPHDECHIGDFDEATCRRVVEVASRSSAQEVREWARQQKRLSSASS